MQQNPFGVGWNTNYTVVLSRYWIGDETIKLLILSAVNKLEV
jgi:hypothetical protein